jgi:hypothetical protein
MLLFADDDNKNSTEPSGLGESEPDADDLLDSLMGGGDDEEEEAAPETPPVGGDFQNDL